MRQGVGRTVSAQVHARLRREILGGFVAPGTLLPPERDLAMKLGANRGAVREALKRLEQAGLVQIVQGSGARVVDWHQSGGLDLLFDLATIGRDPDLDVIRGVLEMRVAQTVDIARLAAARGSPEARAHAAELAEAICQRQEPERPAAMLEFWEALLDASGNVAYRLAYNSLIRGMAMFEDRLDIFAPEVEARELHRDIARALRAGDADEASAATRALVRPTVDRLARGT